MQWKRKLRVRHLRNQPRSLGEEDSGSVRHGAVFPLFPPPSPVIYNQKTSIPRRVESLINPLSLIYQTRCKLFFFSFHQEREKARKTFHLATHFPSLDTLSFAWAKETINYRHCSRFLSSRGSNPILLESRDELVWKRGNREKPDASDEILWSRGGLKGWSSLRYRNGNWHHFHG